MKFTKIFCILLGITLSLTILLTAVEWVSFDLSGHMKLFEKYNIPKETGLTMGELELVMEDILLYFEDERELLDTTIVIDSVEAPAFGERAILHMIDVKELFVKGRVIRNISLVAAILLSLVIIKTQEKRLQVLTRTLFYMALGNFILMGLLFVLLQLDFYKYFTHFHEIFFDNDLWILDPSRELLIKMLPEGFFMDTAIKILSLFVAVNLLMGLLGLYGKLRLKKKNCCL